MTVLRFATHLWFDRDALAAAELYTGLLPDSSIDRVVAAPQGIPGSEPGTPFIVDVTLAGQQVTLFNGGPRAPNQHRPFDSQVSLYVLCSDQADVDRYWDALLADGGAGVACGWLTDRFGLSWQIVPEALERLMSSDDAAAVGRVTAAMLGMVKLDVAGLERAARGD